VDPACCLWCVRLWYIPVLFTTESVLNQHHDGRMIAVWFVRGNPSDSPQVFSVIFVVGHHLPESTGSESGTAGSRRQEPRAEVPKPAPGTQNRRPIDSVRYEMRSGKRMLARKMPKPQKPPQFDGGMDLCDCLPHLGLISGHVFGVHILSLFPSVYGLLRHN
jgi:hypothetical protein